MSRHGATQAPSYGVASESTRESVLTWAIAASTAARNSGLVAVSVSDEKIRVKVEPPARGSSFWMSFDARPDSAVSMNPPLSIQ